MEGWGPECVADGRKATAQREATALAQTWAREGFRAVGVVPVTDADPWFITYGVSGPLAAAAAAQFADEDILDLE